MNERYLSPAMQITLRRELAQLAATILQGVARESHLYRKQDWPVLAEDCVTLAEHIIEAAERHVQQYAKASPSNS